MNKVGRWKIKVSESPVVESEGFFPGLSVIVDSDGAVLGQLDDTEGVAVATVTLDPMRKVTDRLRLSDGGIPALRIGGADAARAIADGQRRGREAYEANSVRRLMARRISGESESNAGP